MVAKHHSFQCFHVNVLLFVLYMHAVSVFGILGFDQSQLYNVFQTFVIETLMRFWVRSKGLIVMIYRLRVMILVLLHICLRKSLNGRIITRQGPTITE